jgi:endonuclease YncB( thermonuclease family)
MSSDLEQKALLAPYTLSNTPELTIEGVNTWAKVLSVYDGDTMTVALPVQDSVFKFQLRINGIDTPEMKGPHKTQAYAARNRMLQLCGLAIALEDMSSSKQVQNMLETNPAYVWLECGSPDKYGRTLADVYASPAKQELFSTIMIKEGHAYAYDGGTKKDPHAISLPAFN